MASKKYLCGHASWQNKKFWEKSSKLLRTPPSTSRAFLASLLRSASAAPIRSIVPLINALCANYPPQSEKIAAQSPVMAVTVKQNFLIGTGLAV